jgi:thioester reductase-like protein
MSQIDTHVRDEKPLDAGAVLLTGATGFVGMELLARYLERTRRRVYALVRAPDEAGASARLAKVLGELFGHEDAHADRVSAVRGDLTEPGLGLGGRRGPLAEEVTEIVHGAASVSFELGLEESRAINVEGTRRVLELAELCQRRGGLRRLSYISTAYVAGELSGSFGENELEVGQRFRNPYERSKFEAERLVRERAGELPVKVFRPSIVVGDSATGWTAAFNVLYWPLRAFERGAYPALPARRSAPVDVVSVDYVADAVFALGQAPGGDGHAYHLTAGSQAASVGELIDMAADRFERPAPRTLRPALYRRVVHPLLVRTGGERRRRLLRRSETFFPYFAMDVTYDDRHARSLLEPRGIRPAPLTAYFDRLVDFAVVTRWGKRPLSRVEARRLATGDAHPTDSHAARQRRPAIGSTARSPAAVNMRRR